MIRFLQCAALPAEIQRVSSSIPMAGFLVHGDALIQMTHR
jgi:hypothetical protein